MGKAWFAVAVIGIMLFAVSSTVCVAESPQERAERAAKVAAEDAGIIVEEAQLIYDPQNKRWEERVAAIEKDPADPNHGKLPHGMLYDKKYETVLLDFKEDADSADAWVFVDKDTGDVILIYEEE